MQAKRLLFPKRPPAPERRCDVKYSSETICRRLEHRSRTTSAPPRHLSKTAGCKQNACYFQNALPLRNADATWNISLKLFAGDVNTDRERQVPRLDIWQKPAASKQNACYFQKRPSAPERRCDKEYFSGNNSVYVSCFALLRTLVWV